MKIHELLNPLPSPAVKSEFRKTSPHDHYDPLPDIRREYDHGDYALQTSSSGYAVHPSSSSSSHSQTTLAASSSVVRKWSPNPPQKLKRPPNAFILYLQDKTKELYSNPDSSKNNASTILNRSKVIGQLWQNEDAQIKAVYRDRAGLIAAQFKRDHPHYIYRPRAPYEIKRRGGKKDADKM